MTEKYSIQCVPTFILLFSQVIAGKVEGADIPLLKKVLETTLPQSHLTALIQPSTLTIQTTQQKIKLLTMSNEIMIFIKGTPKDPKCGFSRECCELMNELRLEYGTYDILSNEEIRQGLKIYSEWPTFPQVYVDGAFIGGVDILKEMISTREFQRLVTQEDIKSKLNRL